MERCCDQRDHEGLMSLLRRRMSDRRVRKRRRQWLKAGGREAGRWRATAGGGAAQGGVPSPLMATISWPVLEMSWAPRDASLGPRTRDADEGGGVCRTRTAAAPALPALAQVIGTRPRHPTKTRLVDVKREGLACRGFSVQTGRARRTGPRVPWMGPGQPAMQAVRSQSRAETARRGLRGAMAAMVAKRNPIMRGGAHRLPHGPRNQAVPGAGAGCPATPGHGGGGVPEGPRGARPPPSAAPSQWPRVLLGAREVRHEPLNAAGRRVSARRLREHRTDGLRWQGMATRIRWGS